VTGLLHIVLARKPIEGTIVENCLQWETGALNIDACRVTTTEKLTRVLGKTTESSSGWKSVKRSPIAGKDGGRWPANLILGGEEVVERFPVTNGAHGGHGNFKQHAWMLNDTPQSIEKSDTGSASRFFYNFSEQESDE